MRNHNSHPHRWFGTVGGRGGRLPLMVSLLLLGSLTGCAAGEGELFLNDVKTFYLNGGLTSSSQANTDPSAEEEGNETDALIGQVWMEEDVQAERGGLLIRALMAGIEAGQNPDAIDPEADGEVVSSGDADDFSSRDTRNVNLEVHEAIAAE